MPIRVLFFSAIIKKSAVRKLYPGGEAAFRADYPYAAEDSHLFGVGSMSGGEFGKIVEGLSNSGLDPQNSFALGAIHQGETKPCPGVLFEKISGGMFPRWDARLVCDDPDVMAEEGAKLYAQILRRGWTLDIPEET